MKRYTWERTAWQLEALYMRVLAMEAEYARHNRIARRPT